MSDRKVISWGGFTNTSFGNALPQPFGISNVTAVASGGYHVLALTSAGRVYAWGNDGSGQCRVPPGLTNAVAIAAGFASGMALTADGRVFAWGWLNQSQVPETLTNAIQIAASDADGFILDRDGNVFQLGIAKPNGWTNVTAIAAGYRHFLGLRADGTVLSSPSNAPPLIAQAFRIDASGNSSRVWIAGPVILTGPTSRVLSPGTNITLSVTARSSTAIAYQWLLNGDPLSGATSTTATVREFSIF